MQGNTNTTNVTTNSTPCPCSLKGQDVEALAFVAAGTWTSVTGKIQVSPNGTDWFDYPCFDVHGTLIDAGTTITLADSTAAFLARVPWIEGLNAVRFLATGFGSGSAPVTVTTGVWGASLPAPLGKQTSPTALGQAGTVTTLAGLLSESSTNGITAFAGGGQGSAVALVSEINRVTTVATAGDSVKLPAATAGLTIVVINKGANALAVFPATGDAIDGGAANSSVTQMVSSMVIYSCTVAGQWDSEGLGTGYSGSLQTINFTNAITAFSGGGQGSAVALTTGLNRITTVAAAGDSVKLPASAAGLTIVVDNQGANSADVFPATGDNINGGAANIQIPCKVGQILTFVCSVAGTWDCVQQALRFISAAASGAVAVQAETIFGTNQFTIRANTLKAGQKIHIRGGGTITTANGTLQLRVRYGGVAGVLVLDTGNAITPSNGDIFSFDLVLTVTDVGATGHVYGVFFWNIGTAGTGTTRAGKTASIAVDTTADKVVNVTQQNGTGAGSITLDYLDAEIY